MTEDDLWDQLEIDLKSRRDKDTPIKEEQVRWLFQQTRGWARKKGLDLGFGCGYSAIAMAANGVVVKCICFDDPTNQRRMQAEKLYEDIIGNAADILNGSTDIELPILVNSGQSEQVHIIFIDAGHRFDDVFIDVHYAKKLLVTGGLLVLDDTQFGAMRSVGNWINTNLAHIWEWGGKLQNTVYWKRTDAPADDSSRGPEHRTADYDKPGRTFLITTENHGRFDIDPKLQPPDNR